MVLLRILLFPFAVLYDGITRLRNLLFDLNLKSSASFSIPVISVGNLAVGGTGKTPLTEHLIRLLINNGYQVATLSRGYGRKTKGMRLANASDSPETMGDEPFQLYQKFGDRAVVSVCEERAMAIPFLVDQFPGLHVVLLDDAFQHRFVTPGLSLLTTRYDALFVNDFLLPTGRLREARAGARRAHMTLVTACPDHLGDEDMIDVEHAIRKYADRPVFFTKIRYAESVCFDPLVTQLSTRKVILVSGVAQAASLKQFVSKNFDLVYHADFTDHHAYTRSEVESLLKKSAEHGAVILTTEKDHAKLDALLTPEEKKYFYRIPIEVEFLKGGADFDALVLDYVGEALDVRE